MNDNSLAELMHLAQQGDAVAYREVLEASSRLVRNYITRRLSARDDVEDVVQEVLVAIHRARHTYTHTRPYTPWLYAIAGFKLKDYLRRAYRLRAHESPAPEFFENIPEEDVTFQEETSEVITEALATLGERQRSIVEKTKLEGYSTREVADQMGMTESAVKVTVHRALKQLRKHLEKAE